MAKYTTLELTDEEKAKLKKIGKKETGTPTMIAGVRILLKQFDFRNSHGKPKQQDSSEQV